MKTIFITAVALLLAVTTVAQQPVQLQQQEKDALLYLREEEKLARDIYDSIYTRWGGNPFGNIRKSEQVHMDRIKPLITNYQLKDPIAATNDNKGKFVNTTLQKVYDSLISKGSASYADALRTAAYVEELDILDLELRMKQTQQQDIITVYNCLIHASEHHLQAFNRHMEKQGLHYAPVLLDKSRFDTIMAQNDKGCPMW